ncbi:MAG: hypothetical protein KJO10_03880, partial [Gammaproteobacteria bacterium]|nr:hypothetical protein [Gammaproteobacteria bacterium]
YEETNGSILLDRETGVLPGIMAGVRLTQEAWYAEVDVSWWSGRVDYNSFVPPVLASNTDEDIFNTTLIAGRELWHSGQTDAGLYAGLGYREWQRNIRSVPGVASGLNEEYTWWYGMLGARAGMSVSARTRIHADVRLVRTINPEIDVDFGGLYDTASADLGADSGYRVAFTVEHALGNTATFWLSPWYEVWKLDRSRDVPLFLNGVPVMSGGMQATFFEPDSETHNAGINIGVTWRFGRHTSLR